MGGRVSGRLRRNKSAELAVRCLLWVCGVPPQLLSVSSKISSCHSFDLQGRAYSYVGSARDRPSRYQWFSSDPFVGDLSVKIKY